MELKVVIIGEADAVTAAAFTAAAFDEGCTESGNLCEGACSQRSGAMERNCSTREAAERKQPKGVVDLHGVAALALERTELRLTMKAAGGGADVGAVIRVKARTTEAAVQWYDACAQHVDPSTPPPAGSLFAAQCSDGAAAAEGECAAAGDAAGKALSSEQPQVLGPCPSASQNAKDAGSAEAH